MEKSLLIIFVKNILLGKVKTRLAKTIGNQSAFDVYKHLVEITEKESEKVDNCDIHIYFSDAIIEEKWKDQLKFIQEGSDLGERMKNAFRHGFDLGYTKVIGIGSDLPDLTEKVLRVGIDTLDNNDTVFGPASDGGYYLLGMKQIIPEVFENKKWSTEGLLKNTLEELHENGISFSLLEELNDIDTIEDLERSSVADKFNYLLTSNK